MTTPYDFARDMIERNCLILDTETTGLDDRAEVIEIAVVDLAGNVLLNELVRPLEGMNPSALRTHHITLYMLTRPGVRTFPPVLDDLFKIIRGRAVVTYGARFDLQMLTQTAARYGLDARFDALTFNCLMMQYAEHNGVIHPYHGTYQWAKLEVACAEFGIEAGNHRALSDAQAARQLLLALAAIEKEVSL